MAKPDFTRLLEKQVTRKEFLRLGAVVGISLFGVTAVIRELLSQAATSTASGEAEAATLSGGAVTISDATASGGQAITFGSGGGIQAGALPLGQANYAKPTSNVIYLATNGNDGNVGSEASPKATLQNAITACPSGGTVVIRGGVYEQKYSGSVSKPLTIQNYPGEAVWFDGSKRQTAWTPAGNGTWWAPLFAKFDNTLPENYRGGVNRNFPMAVWPDMVHIDGVRQQHRPGTGVIWWDTSPAGGHETDVPVNITPETPGPGEFIMDYPNNRVYIGQDPTGKEVRLSALDQWMIIQAQVTVRGIGIRRYATTLTSASATIIIASNAPNAVLENVWSEDNGIQSISFRANGGGIRSSTIRGATELGIHSDRASNFDVSNCIVEGNNFNMWENEPGAGGIKLSRAKNVTIKNSIFRNNNSSGIWFDVSCYDNTIFNNVLSGNRGPAIEYEISQKVLIANNWITGAGTTSIWALDSGEVQLWNNMVDRAASFDIRLQEDSRAGTVSSGENPDGVQTWRTEHTVVCNNVLANYSNRTGVWRLELENISITESAASYFDRIGGNVISTTTATSGTSSVSRMAAVENASGTVQTYTTPSALQSAFGTTKIGTNTVAAFTVPTTAQLSSWASTADAIPAAVATLMGVPTGTKAVGPVTAAPQPRH